MRIWQAAPVAVFLLAGCAGHHASAPSVATGPVNAPKVAGLAAVTAAQVGPDPRVGAVFLGGGTLHTCTGSVLHSAGGDLVLTAAHCLADGLPATFVPAFVDQAAPADVWTVDTVYLDPRWVAAQDPRADYAIIRVSRDGGGPIEAQTGAALTLGTAPKAGTPVTITGYPLGDGGGPLMCQADSEVSPDGYPTLKCGGLVDGTSGAPWISGSTATGVIGGLDGGGCDENVSYSAPFDADTVKLLARAEAGGSGDAAPNTFATSC
ncbi:trypsin-like peptidase domain-containing protein [soil metagenome]